MSKTYQAILARQAARKAPEPVKEAVPYRDLQAQAKELDIPANQSREELEAAIAEAGEE